MSGYGYGMPGQPSGGAPPPGGPPGYGQPAPGQGGYGMPGQPSAPPPGGHPYGQPGAAGQGGYGPGSSAPPPSGYAAGQYGQPPPAHGGVYGGGGGGGPPPGQYGQPPPGSGGYGGGGPPPGQYGQPGAYPGATAAGAGYAGGPPGHHCPPGAHGPSPGGYPGGPPGGPGGYPGQHHGGGPGGYPGQHGGGGGLPPPSAQFQSNWYAHYYNSMDYQNQMRLLGWFQSIDHDRSQSITASELATMELPGTHGTRLAGRKLGLAAAKQMIRLFDHDKSKTISFHEYGALYGFLSKLINAFIRADKDRSGSLDSGEIHHALDEAGFKVAFKPVQMYYKKYAAGGRGIGIIKFLALSTDLALVRSGFEKLDKKKSGKLDMDQVLQLMASLSGKDSTVGAKMKKKGGFGGAGGGGRPRSGPGGRGPPRGGQGGPHGHGGAQCAHQ